MASSFTLSVLIQAIDHATGPLRKVGSAIGNLDKGTKEALRSVGGAFQKYGAIVAGSMLAIGAVSVRERNKVTAALGELSSLGIQDLEALRKAGRDFSNEWAGTTTPEFVSASYDIKSAISTLTDEGVAEYTRLAALTAKATKSTVATQTSLFATGFGIFKELMPKASDMEFAQTFSAGIAGAVQAFKTTGSEMEAAISSFGASGTKANIKFEEQLAILGQLQQVMSGSEAGTKFKAFVQSAGKAGNELGLKFLDANKNLKSVPDILDVLRKKYGDTLDAMESQQITEAFGTKESVDFIKILMGQTDGLRTSISSLSKTTQQGAAFTENMARTMNTSLGAAQDVAKQRFFNLAESIGKALEPALVSVLTPISNMILSMQKYAEENPNVVRGVMLLVGALGLAAVVIGTAATAVAAFNLAILANPATWIVAGIMGIILAIVALGVAIYTYRKEIANFLKPLTDLAARLWRGAKDAGLRFLAGLRVGLANVPAAIVGLLADIGALYYEFYSWVLSGVAGLAKDFIKVLLGLFDDLTGLDVSTSVAVFWENFKAAFAENLAAFKRWFTDGLFSIVDALPLSVRNLLSGGGKFEVEQTAKSTATTSVRAAEQKAAMAQKSRVDGQVQVTFNNPPPRTQVTTQSSSTGGDFRINSAISPAFGVP